MHLRTAWHVQLANLAIYVNDKIRAMVVATARYKNDFFCSKPGFLKLRLRLVERYYT